MGELEQQDMRERIRRLEQDMEDLKAFTAVYNEQQRRDERSLSVLRHIAAFGVVTRWLTIFTLGLLAMIGSFQAAFDLFHYWFGLQK